MNVLQTAPALATVRAEVWFSTKPSLIVSPHICCVDSDRIQSLTSFKVQTVASQADF